MRKKLSKPNIILIMADQLRWDCLGFAGNPDVKTPNLDVLAAHGLTFSQALSTATDSAAAHLSLLSGRYPSELGDLSAEATLPRVLQASGYATAAVGKMNFSPPRADYGFEHLVIAEEGKAGREADDYHRWLSAQGKTDRIGQWAQMDSDAAPMTFRKSLGAMRSNLTEQFHSTTWIGNQALSQIRQLRDPFFLCVSFMKPQAPYDPPSPWDTLYDRDALRLPPDFQAPAPKQGASDTDSLTEARFRKVLAFYYANISHVDKQIGRLLATLNARGITNNIVVFCASQGNYMGQHGLIGKASGQLYDAVLRIPLVLAGVPGQRRGAVDEALVQLHDLTPTLLEVAGLSAPQDLSGLSLAPQLLAAKPFPRSYAYLQAPGEAHVLRSAHYKLVESEEASMQALYDLAADPYEFENQYHHSEAAPLKSEVQEALRQVRSRLKPAP